MNAFLQALGLLTVLPVHGRLDDASAPGRAMAAYPLAGLVIGALLAALGRLLLALPAPVAGGLLAPALLLAAWAALTGALHLDGWSDCCDALFVPVDRDRRLAIMKDPRLGSFGATGLLLLLVVKFAALAGLLQLAAGGGWLRLWPLLAATATARWFVVLAARLLPPARPEGMAVYFRRGLGRRELLLASLTLVPVAALAVWLAGWPALLLWPAAALVAAGLGRLALVRLGGATGDVYGALIELTETTVLVTACLLGL